MNGMPHGCMRHFFMGWGLRGCLEPRQIGAEGAEADFLRYAAAIVGGGVSARDNVFAASIKLVAVAAGDVGVALALQIVAALFNGVDGAAAAFDADGHADKGGGSGEIGDEAGGA